MRTAPWHSSFIKLWFDNKIVDEGAKISKWDYTKLHSYHTAIKEKAIIKWKYVITNCIPNKKLIAKYVKKSFNTIAINKQTNKTWALERSKHIKVIHGVCWFLFLVIESDCSFIPLSHKEKEFIIISSWSLAQTLQINVNINRIGGRMVVFSRPHFQLWSSKL